MGNKYKSFLFRFDRKFKRISLLPRIKYSLAFKKSDYVLLMSPIHGNLGDHAIACAEEQIVNSLGRTLLDIPEIEMLKREEVFANFIPKNKTILIHGGGFLGSIWPEEEYEFRKILTEFSEHRIIVFPQTVTFDLSTNEGRKFFEDSKKIYEGHKNLLIFVRDVRSFNFMKDYMSGVNCQLVPDVVTQYQVAKRDTNRSGVLMCMRSDHEKNLDDSIRNSIENCVKERFQNEEITYTDTVVKRFIYPWTRKQELDEKFNQIASAKFVVTDRLHGMIFSAITHTPCIAFNNVNGKVGAQYEWIKNNPYIKMASNFEDFKEQLKNLDVDCTYEYNCDYARTQMRPLFDKLK